MKAKKNLGKSLTLWRKIASDLKQDKINYKIKAKRNKLQLLNALGWFNSQ